MRARGLVHCTYQICIEFAVIFISWKEINYFQSCGLISLNTTCHDPGRGSMRVEAKFMRSPTSKKLRLVGREPMQIIKLPCGRIVSDMSSLVICINLSVLFFPFHGLKCRTYQGLSFPHFSNVVFGHLYN